MGKGIGIAALVISILAIFIPIISIYVVWIALILAAISSFNGEKTYSIASLVICVVNVLLLSPATMLVFAGESLGGGSALKIITLILFLAPIAGLVLSYNKTKKVVAQ